MPPKIPDANAFYYFIRNQSHNSSPFAAPRQRILGPTSPFFHVAVMMMMIMMMMMM